MPLGRQTAPLLRDGRPQRVPADALEALTMRGQAAPGTDQIGTVRAIDFRGDGCHRVDL